MRVGAQAQTASDDLSEQLPAVEHLLSSLAHDIKNPLSIVRGNAQLALIASKDEKVAICLRRIIDAVDGMTESLNEVRCLRRPLESTLECLDLASIVHHASEAVISLAQRSAVQLYVSSLVSVTVYGNREMLETAFIHLIRNAVDAMPEGGKLEIESYMHEGKVYVAISDTGHGIPAEYQEKVFKRFFSTKPGGCGWGLVIVDQVVRESHGGLVEYVTGDHGTTFTVSLPIQQPIAATV